MQAAVVFLAIVAVANAGLLAQPALVPAASITSGPALYRAAAPIAPVALAAPVGIAAAPIAPIGLAAPVGLAHPVGLGLARTAILG